MLMGDIQFKRKPKYNKSERLLSITFDLIGKHCSSSSGMMFYFIMICKIMVYLAITKYCMAYNFVADSAVSTESFFF